MSGAKTGAGAVVGATTNSGLKWTGLRIGPGGCGHCWDCRHPRDEDGEEATCRFLEPLHELEEDEESDACEICEQRNCPWHCAVEDVRPDAGYQGFLQGQGVGFKEGVQAARYWQRPITAMFKPPMGSLPGYVPDADRDPWSPRPTWQEFLKSPEVAA